MTASLEELARLGGFTLEAVTANRTGRLSAAQRERGMKSSMGGAVVLVVLSLLVLGGAEAGAFLFHQSLRQPPDRVDLNAVYAIAVVGVVVSLALLFAAVNWVRNTRARRRLYAEGAVDSADVVFQMDPLKQQFADSFLIAAGNRRAFLRRDVGRRLVSGQRYRLYFLGNELVSFEPV